ncbi:tetratricopeptide repeat protein (macronuclear) [Tetrahymena thermophila SB210]|uniref:Tetratricopeptide repeat protein n=1 Tax=Tetrahymena thermophila (strain SB210) TaxID=312017 RepID=I7M069_TETTS|nr:tetratricopeptide repeat protein [Tetrahymena thermophila SB210]EAR85587.1 tetratricopeptide repeat protein [Tetrahymena thermophila SB210]|eukprot:XP_001033250.1 tetratricopeptide repeat protein [Tetrahymena thermophila SB210]
MSQIEENSTTVQKDPTEFTPTSFKVIGKREDIPVLKEIGQKIDESKRLKEEGNQFFKQKDYKKALSSYNKAILYVIGLVGENDEHYQYGNASSKLNEEQDLIVKELKSSLYLNISQIDLFNKNYAKCIERATKSLDIKQTAKGYYRRAIAYMELNDFQRSQQDFQKSLQLDQTLEKDIQQKIQILKQKEKQEDKKSQAFYSKMFN